MSLHKVLLLWNSDVICGASFLDGGGEGHSPLLDKLLLLEVFSKMDSSKCE